MKLESIDAASKPKVIKEVKALVPNLTLIEVRGLLTLLYHFTYPLRRFFHHLGYVLPDLTDPARTLCHQAKKFVESLPKVLKENLPKEDAEKLKKVFEGLGGVVKLE